MSTNTIIDSIVQAAENSDISPKVHNTGEMCAACEMQFGRPTCDDCINSGGHR